MNDASTRTLEDHLYRISSKIIFLKEYLQSTEALPGLVDIVEDLEDEAKTAVDMWEDLPKSVEDKATDEVDHV